MLNRLSKREAEVLQLMCGGCTDSEAAAELGITPASVRHHVRAIQVGTQERSISTLCRALATANRAAARQRKG